MTQIDRSLIASSAFFADLSTDEAEVVLARARAQRYARDSVVFEQGQPTDRFFTLVSGHVRVVKTTPDGQQVIMRYIAPGEPFGIGVAAGFAHYPATAICAADSAVLTWKSSDWPDLIARIPALAANALRALGHRIQDAHERVVEVSTQQSERRIAHAILRLAEQAGRKIKTGVEIDFPLSRQDIAAMTGLSLFTVSRVLSGWEQSELVESGRMRVVLKQPQRLRAIAAREDS